MAQNVDLSDVWMYNIGKDSWQQFGTTGVFVARFFHTTVIDSNTGISYTIAGHNSTTSPGHPNPNNLHDVMALAFPGKYYYYYCLI